MLKRCSAYKIFCDCCGARISGVFENKEAAIMYAVCCGLSCREVPYVYCSKKCKNKLIKQIKQQEKGGKR